MRRLMAIFAHPDDESAIGGTLIRHARNGTEVVLVCATRGEVGGISDPSLATPETLGQVRQGELEEVCRIMGVQHLEWLDYRDSGMVDSDENNDPRALVQADPQAVTEQLADLMRKYRPDAVVTFEPFGWYGHPDHQVVSRWVTEAFPLANNGSSKLFHAVIPFSKFSAVIQSAVEAGLIENPEIAEGIPEEQQHNTEAQVTHILDVRDLFDTKQDAMMSHRTQFGDDNFFRKIPRDMMVNASGQEYFIQVYPPPQEGLTENPLTDLFA